MNRPAISIVMPVYNCDRYVHEAMDSILSQTMNDFELIMVNDGSNDNSGEIIHSYQDQRIRIIDIPDNIGCYPARNIGMKTARGKYICVMDADDVCMPQRLEIQYNYLEKNHEIGLVASAINIGDRLKFYRETDYETIKLMLLRFCYLPHPTCMMRSSLLKKHHLLYNENYTYASDYDWQLRASSLFPVSIINKILLFYRLHPKQISSEKQSEQTAFADQIRLYQLSFLNIIPTEEEKQIHLNLVRGHPVERFSTKVIDPWIARLVKANAQTGYFHQARLEIFLHVLRTRFMNR